MRITNQMTANRLISNVNKNLNTLEKYNMQGSTGKKIQKASENPIIASRALRYRTIVSDIDQYIENTHQASSWLEVTDTAMNNVNEILTQMRSLCNQGATDTYTTEDRNKMLTEYNSLLSQLENELNSTYMGRYIFSGFRTDQKPITKDNNGKNILNPDIYGDKNPPVKPSVDGQVIEIEVGTGVSIDVNTVATDIYNKDDYDNLHSFDDIYEYINSDAYKNLDEADKLAADKQMDIRGKMEKMLTTIDDYMAKVSNEQTKVGVKMNHSDLIEERLSTNKISYSKLMSENEDINIAEVTTNISTANTTYTAALKIGMNINKLSLVDYL